MISVTGITPRYSTSPSTGTDAKSNTNNNGSGGSNAITNAAGGSLGKDEFVKLLVTQMQNQDPLNPMDGKDLAVQLAQFSSVEQLMNINSKLDSLTAALTASNTTPTGSNNNGTSAV